MNSFEYYDLATGAVTTLPPLHTSRDEVTLVYLKGDLYAVGGGGKQGESLKSVEKYSQSKREWTIESELLIERRAHAALAINEQIFVIGGFDGEKYLHSCEKYAAFTEI